MSGTGFRFAIALLIRWWARVAGRGSGIEVGTWDRDRNCRRFDHGQGGGARA
jgi:hypothetical protein